MKTSGIPVASLPRKLRDKYNALVTGKKAPRKKGGQTESEKLLAQQIGFFNLPVPVRNYKLAVVPKNPRGWEADFAWPPVALSIQKPPAFATGLAVFIDGKVHGVEAQRVRDCERDNVLPLICPQWTIFKFTAGQVRHLIAVESIKAWLAGDPDAVLKALQHKPSYIKAK